MASDNIFLAKVICEIYSVQFDEIVLICPNTDDLVAFEKLIIVEFKFIDSFDLNIPHLTSLSKSGFQWLGYKFEYFLCKDSNKLSSYFLRVLEYHDVYAFCHSIADFKNQPTISRAAMRMSLLVSGTYPTSKHNETQDSISIQIIDDIIINDDNVTDGSGFISADFVANFPLHIIQGQLINTISISKLPSSHYSNSTSTSTSPAAYQALL
eukprot:gene9131-18918_t